DVRGDARGRLDERAAGRGDADGGVVARAVDPERAVRRDRADVRPRDRRTPGVPDAAGAAAGDERLAVHGRDRDVDARVYDVAAGVHEVLHGPERADGAVRGG